MRETGSYSLELDALWFKSSASLFDCHYPEGNWITKLDSITALITHACEENRNIQHEESRFH
jgi:hypothetical protein